MPGSSGKQERFVWPPSPSVAAPVEIQTVAHETKPISAMPRKVGFFVRAERALLDPIAEPIRERAARCGWVPDVPGDYCDRCGHTIGPHEGDEMGCAGCSGQRVRWDRVVRLGAYDTELSRWIQEVKFTRWTRLGVDLGRWLGESVRGQRVFMQESAGDKSGVVVPMPISLRRRWARGIDHSGVIARGVAAELGLPLARAMRRAHRPSQRRIAVSKRGPNVRGTFVCRQKTGILGRSVILVDDVLTSGATASEAARVLLGEGGAASVVVAVLGVAGEGR